MRPSNNFIKSKLNDLEHDKVEENFIEYNNFYKQSAKNTNLTVNEVFARQIRTIRGLGIENITSIVKIFRTPNILYDCFLKCKSDSQALNLINSAKHELLRLKILGIEDQTIKYPNIIKQAKPKVFNEMLKSSYRVEIIINYL